MKPLLGVACGSGVARGWAHIGVLKALERAGLRPDVVAGTSIGAVVGGIYAAGRLHDLEAWALSLTRKRAAGFFDVQFGGGGVIAGRRVLSLFPPEIAALQIEDLPVPFAAVATDLATGHKEWIKSGPLLPALHASYAIPGLFAPCRIDGRWLVDGALSDPVPVAACRMLGAKVVLASNLNGEAYASAPADDSLDLPVEDDQEGKATKLFRSFFRRPQNESEAPGVFAVLARSLNIVTDQIARARLAIEPPEVQVYPSMRDVGIFDFHRAKECIAAGEAAAEASMPKLLDALRRAGCGVGPRDRIPLPLRA